MLHRNNMSEKIKSAKARKIVNSRGAWTIEVTLETDSGFFISSVPQGESRGKHEAVSVEPEKAVEIIGEEISNEIKSFKVGDQKAFDNLLIELDGTETKERLGGNSILALSICYARASASKEKQELWEYFQEISNGKQGKLKLLMNMIEGGVHAGSDLRFQEYLVIPETYSLKASIDAGVDFYKHLGKALEETVGSRSLNLGFEGGYTPALKDDDAPLRIFKMCANSLNHKIDFSYGIDAAGSNIVASSQMLAPIYSSISEEYPLSYLEDPFEEEDFTSHARLLEMIGKKTNIVGDDLTVTSPNRIERAKEDKSCNGVIIKPNQIGTISETLEAIKIARDAKWQIVCSHRGGETNDDFIADFAWGVGADGLKLGAPARGERVSKYNRLLEIEAEGKSEY